MLSRSTTKVKIKTTNLANKTGYTSNISIPYDGQKNHDLESFLDPSPLTRSLIFGKNTAICRSCVQVQSHELRMSLHFPKNCMTKLCRRESKDTLRQKHALALCTKRKQSFSDHDDHKIQRWFLFFLFKSKTNKKGEEISNIQPIYEILQDLQTKLYSSAIWRIHPGLLFYSSLTKFHPKRDVVISCKERQKIKHQPS